MLAPAKCSPRRKRVKHKPVRFSPQLDKKKSKAMTIRKPGLPSGICPKCKVFVNGTSDDGGVVCVTCDAYWHFTCAKLSPET